MRFLYLFLPFALMAQTPPAPAQPKAPPTPAQPKAAPPAAPVTPAKPAAQSGDPVVLSVGSFMMKQSEFEKLFESLPEQAQKSGKRKVAEQIAEIKGLAQQARERKVDQNPKIQQQMALQIDTLLVNALYQDLTTSIKISDADVKKYYDEHKNDYESVKARHILIRFAGSRVPLKPNQKDLTDAEALAKAKELQKKIAGGLDFAQIAKDESDDTGSGAQGGDLGSFNHGQMVEAFDAAAFSLAVGKVSDPVKTPFGYHVIQVQEHTSKTFEEAKPQIEATLRPEMARKMMEELKNKTTPKLDEGYFGK